MKPHCLVLDKRFYPFMILNFKRAFILSLKDVDVIEYHPKETIRTINKSFPIPIVIRVNEIINIKNMYVYPTRYLIFIRDNWTCQYCGKSVNEKTATIDHVVPKSKGGAWSWLNLVTACEECNQKKGDQIWIPINKPKRPEPFVIVLQKVINKLDNETISTWINYLPIKYRKIIKSLNSGGTKI